MAQSNWSDTERPSSVGATLQHRLIATALRDQISAHTHTHTTGLEDPSCDST